MTSIGNTINTKRTINRQEQQEEQVQEQQTDYHYHNNNIIITTRSRACSEAEAVDELPGDEIMGMIAEAYKANIAPMITQAGAMVIENALKAGMEPRTVIMAIEETGMASRPSPYYLRAVLRNWAEWGVYTSRAREQGGRTEGQPWWKR